MPFRRTLVLAPLAALAALAATASGGDGPWDVPLAGADATVYAPQHEFRAATTLYSHGEPTNEEQFFLELMNRARADPRAEGDRVFNDYGDPIVRDATNYFIRQRPKLEFTRAENRAAFRTYPKQPPFAFNAQLIAAARKHSRKSVQFDRQGHQFPGEPALGGRVADEGYQTANLSESVYATARSMLFAHALFTIDSLQDVEPGEKRPSTPHRLSLMNYDGTKPFIEVGVGVAADTNPATHVGPRIITVDFAEPLGPPGAALRFVTGVCYEDRNANRVYDMGEGLRGVRIESPAAEVHTISSASGGYALPVPLDAGQIFVTATGEAGGASEAVGVQTVLVTMAGANVKVDFQTPPDPPPPPAQTFTSILPLALADGATVDATIDVPAFDAASPTVGEVDVAVALVHPDASELTLTLISPAGTEVVLFDRGLPVADLTGTFDATIAPKGDLDAFADEAYAGTWKLRVADAAGGGVCTVSSWSVIVRPAWVRGIFAPRTNLALTSFRATPKAAAAADTLRLVGTVDASGRDLDRSAPILLRLLRADGSEIQRFDATALKAAGRATLKTVFAVRRTSKATFDVTLRKQDLAEALPSPVTVEMSIGGAIVRQGVPLAKGAYTSAKRPPAPFFRIDSLRSAIVPAGPGPVAGDVMVTTVKGRLTGVSLPLTGVIDVFLGDAHAKLTPAAFKRTGTRVTAKTSTLLKQVILDTKTGAFTVVVRGEPFELFANGRVPFSLRVGPNVLGATEVKATSSGTTARY